MSSLDPTGSHGLTPEITARLTTFVEATTDLFGVTDDAGRVVYVNEATRKRLGLTGEEVLTLTTTDIFPESAFQIYFEQIRPAILRSAVWTGYLPVKSAQGNIIEFWATVVGGTRPGGEVSWLVVSGRDVTGLREANDELRRQASHDDLTGLARRVVLEDRLEQAIARAHRAGDKLAVAFLDVDDLKGVNDAFGHRGGDEVLIEVGRRLTASVRGPDTVARLGGDEFVVVCDGVVDEHEAMSLCTRMRAAVTSTPIQIRAGAVAVAISVGLAMGDGDSRPDELLRQADVAMYTAKRGPHPATPFLSVQSATAARPRVSVHEVATALTQKLIAPHFQPVLELASDTVIGYQALARWGERTAAEFIDVDEDSGTGLSLDLTILRLATAEAARWQAGAPRRLYVHVSARLIADPAAELHVHDALTRAGLDPSRLALEIPQHLVGRSGAFVDGMRSLRSLGIRLVMSHFDRYNPAIVDLAEDLFDELRLGRDILAAMDRRSSDARAVAGAISLAHGLGLTAFAVGVETDRQLDRLRSLGCDLVEGQLIGGAVPPTMLPQRSAHGSMPA